MSRYVFQFTKVDGMRFISHLDLQRLFRRVFRRIGVELVFSNGYNPHPRMNIAQPLSLGFESESEYLEIETQSPLELEQVLAEANLALPEGISLVRGTEAEASAKNLSSVVDYAEYSAYVADWNSIDMESALAQFNLQNTIIVIKSDKKAKKTVEKDVKGMIYLFEGSQLPEGGYVSYDPALGQQRNPESASADRILLPKDPGTFRQRGLPNRAKRIVSLGRK